MELFDESGCLTPEGMHALVDGTLEETQRMEAAEHLSFCDECLVRYTQLLTDDVLIAPKESLVPQVQKRVRGKAAQIFFNRYTRAAAAVVLAMALWSAGAFDVFSTAPKNHKSEDLQPQVRLTQQVQNFWETTQQKISDGIQNVFRIPQNSTTQER